MNKLVITLCLLTLQICAFGQEEATTATTSEVTKSEVSTDSEISTKSETSIKPESKSITAEVNFSPLSSSPIYINYLRFRFFNSDSKAFRLGASIGIQNESPDEDVTT